MTAYYNEHDKYAAQWLRNLIAQNLIAPGDVDERSIADVKGSEIAKYTQVHFFAGIGGWSLAARLAGIPDDEPLWTGSCPCQPFSGAGKQQGTADVRHLWPEMRRLIEECRPSVVAGEQVASKLGREWLAGVRADLEGLGYAVGAADLCAAGARAPHIRQRLFWLADAGHGAGTPGIAGVDRTSSGRGEENEHPAIGSGTVRGLADADGRLAGDGDLQPRGQHGLVAEDGRAAERLGHAAAGGQRIDGRASGRGGHADIASASVGLADADGSRTKRESRNDGEASGISTEKRSNIGTSVLERSRKVRGVAQPDRRQRDRKPDGKGRIGDRTSPGWLQGHGELERNSASIRLGNASSTRTGRLTGTVSATQEERDSQGIVDGSGSVGVVASGTTDFWSTYDVVHCTDGKTRRFESFAQPLVDGLPASLGPISADIVEEIEKEIAHHAATTSTDPRTALRDLQLSLSAQVFAGQTGLQSSAFLLSFLRQLSEQGWSFAESFSRTRTEIPATSLRGVRNCETSARAPRRRRLDEQRVTQSSNTLHFLSSILARAAQAVWGQTYATNAAATFPLAVGVPNRVGRLRGYGNAIVPQVAAEFLKAAFDSLQELDRL